MSSDKTLATAKHGGCVQLATAPERCAECRHTTFELHPDGHICVHCKLIVADQPSPFETLPPEMRSGAQGYLDYLDTLPGWSGDALDLDRVLSLADVHAEESREDGVRLLDRGGLLAFAQDVVSALAARQPVGEPVARLIEAVEGECEGLTISRDTAASILAHVFPVSRVAAAYMVDGRIEQGLFFDRASAENMAAMNAGDVVPLFRPPAQAVDRPYSLDADPAGIRARVADVITGTLMVGAQGHTPPPVGHWAEPFWQAARADATAQAMDLGAVRNAVQGITLGFDGDLPYIKGIAEVLALIDGKAVGK